MSTRVDHQVSAALERISSTGPPTLVFRRRDLLAAGVTDAEQSAMFRRGMIVRLRHGVYAIASVVQAAPATQRHIIDVAAAISAAEEPAWAFGASAAVVHGLPLPFDVPEHVELLRWSRQDGRSLTRPSRHGIQLPGVLVTTHAVTEDQVTMVQGVPTVGRALAAVSAARDLSHRRKVVIFDAALWDGRSAAADLVQLVDEWRSRGGRTELLEAISQARRGAQSPLETYSRLALVAEGLPEPVLQAEFHDSAGLIGYTDMYWPELRVVGEADGAVKYGSRDDLIREKVREDRLRALGLRVVRWMAQEIRDDPAAVARRIRQDPGRWT